MDMDENMVGWFVCGLATYLKCFGNKGCTNVVSLVRNKSCHSGRECGECQQCKSCQHVDDDGGDELLMLKLRRLE